MRSYSTIPDFYGSTISPTGSAIAGRHASVRAVLIDPSRPWRQSATGDSIRPGRLNKYFPRFAEVAGRRCNDRFLADEQLTAGTEGRAHVVLAHKLNRSYAGRRGGRLGNVLGGSGRRPLIAAR